MADRFDPMYVLTAKRDGGTQDVIGFYPEHELATALNSAEHFLRSAVDANVKRAIIRLEYYNAAGHSKRE